MTDEQRNDEMLHSLCFITIASKGQWYNKRTEEKFWLSAKGQKVGKEWKGIHIYTCLGKQRRSTGRGVDREKGTVPKIKKQVVDRLYGSYCTENYIDRNSEKQGNNQSGPLVAVGQTKHKSSPIVKSSQPRSEFVILTF